MQIDKQVRDKRIVFETTTLAVQDLERYYKGLDKVGARVVRVVTSVDGITARWCVAQALMHYHHMKIKEINTIIRELWTNTYKGQDIENIEIRCGLLRAHVAAGVGVIMA